MQLPIYYDPARPYKRAAPLRKILFASSHAIVDPCCGASVSALDSLNEFKSMGYDCQAFCTNQLNTHKEIAIEEILSRMDCPYQSRPSVCGACRGMILQTRVRQVPVSIVITESWRGATLHPDEMVVVLTFFERFLESYRPDVVFSDGEDVLSRGMMSMAKNRDIPIICSVHNFAQNAVDAFWCSDFCTVSSQFARRAYWETLGVACHCIPRPVDWTRAQATHRSPRFVTFVNPCLDKGVLVFARIAECLMSRRPDIPLLVVESRGSRETMAAQGVGDELLGRIRFQPIAPDPRSFWGVSKLALIPSVRWEDQPLVAIEAMINGVPVIASDRGAIQETLGESGFTLSLPDDLTPVSEIGPTAEDVELWIEIIIRLWDDERLYARESAKAKHEAQRWDRQRLRPRWTDFFEGVVPQPGPPFLPR